MVEVDLIGEDDGLAIGIAHWRGDYAVMTGKSDSDPILTVGANVSSPDACREIDLRLRFAVALRLRYPPICS